MPVECHLRRVIGRAHSQVAWWGSGCSRGTDADTHHGQAVAWPLFYDEQGELRPKIMYVWTPTLCQYCGVAYDGSEISRHASLRRIFDTDDGDLHPGDMYWADWTRGGHSEKCWYWDNCAGPHLNVMLPNNMVWDIDSRASNCTLPEDRVHRCWIREGEPPKVTAGKAGLTCSAGAGSIQSGDYHGFLQGGILS